MEKKHRNALVPKPTLSLTPSAVFPTRESPKTYTARGPWTAAAREGGKGIKEAGMMEGSERRKEEGREMSEEDRQIVDR